MFGKCGQIICLRKMSRLDCLAYHFSRSPSKPNLEFERVVNVGSEPDFGRLNFVLILLFLSKILFFVKIFFCQNTNQPTIFVLINVAALGGPFWFREKNQIFEKKNSPRCFFPSAHHNELVLPKSILLKTFSI